MMNDRTVLIVIGAMLVILMGSILYVTHQPASTTGMRQAVSTTTLATSTTPGATATNQKTTSSEKSTLPSTASHQSGGPTHTTVPATPPHIVKFLPAAGTTGTSVTIIGSGFSSSGNHVLFGSSENRYHADGTPANQIASVGSSDGISITFTVPSSGPSGLLCDQSGCIAVSATAITPGSYPVTITNAAGTSNTVSFIVVK